MELKSLQVKVSKRRTFDEIEENYGEYFIGKSRVEILKESKIFYIPFENLGRVIDRIGEFVEPREIVREAVQMAVRKNGLIEFDSFKVRSIDLFQHRIGMTNDNSYSPVFENLYLVYLQFYKTRRL